MKVIYHEKIDKNLLPKGSTAETYIFCIEILDIKSYAKVLIDDITDTSWISKLDDSAKMSYQIVAKRTIDKLVRIFKSTKGKIHADFGEFMISISSGKCLKEKHSHECLPISEIWKEKLSNNPGFDFHTLSPQNKFSFGESKFVSSGNSYTEAAKQTHEFSRNGKDKVDSVHLQHFASNYAIQNLKNDRKGYIVSFSINSDNYKLILKNSLKNKDIKALTKRCDELYIIGVKA